MKWNECDCEAVLSVRSLEREVLMSATEETESSGSDEKRSIIQKWETQKKALLAM